MQKVLARTRPPTSYSQLASFVNYGLRLEAGSGLRRLSTTSPTPSMQQPHQQSHLTLGSLSMQTPLLAHALTTTQCLEHPPAPTSLYRS